MRTYIGWVIRFPCVVIVATIATTLLLTLSISRLKVIVDPSTFLPQTHPFVKAINNIEEVFGSQFVVVIGISSVQGDIFQASVLDKVERMTMAFQNSPLVAKENLLSLSARRAKSISGTSEGIAVQPLMLHVPRTNQEMETLRREIESNPIYLDSVVSRDFSTAGIIVEFLAARRESAPPSSRTRAPDHERVCCPTSGPTDWRRSWVLSLRSVSEWGQRQITGSSPLKLSP